MGRGKEKELLSLPTMVKSNQSSSVVMGFSLEAECRRFLSRAFCHVRFSAPSSRYFSPLKRASNSAAARAAEFSSLQVEVLRVIASTPSSAPCPHAHQSGGGCWGGPSWPLLYLSSGSCVVAATRKKLVFLGKAHLWVFKQREFSEVLFQGMEAAA